MRSLGSVMATILIACTAEPQMTRLEPLPPSAACRISDELAERIEARTGDLLGSYDETRLAWSRACVRDAYMITEAGACEDGATVFLQAGRGFGGETRFYDRVSGELLGLMTSGDTTGGPCDGRRYWRSRVVCSVDEDERETLCWRSKQRPGYSPRYLP